ncbi:23S rRNA (adenine(2503)-C(2))-methyltransferase RlmN [Frankia sp. AgB1.9]|uniref:23S rRNA (adenine(2503)-C(2))-methyltransferase RlmN n=1 Tax=unclassified Frankia TaxID=2632575 RepID=UPI001EE47768|nr:MULTISPECIES: 23S rRNA (adenine(2503)-C(2))-methyltransferase RlmN [unclassified Frankia]MBL7488961.1 23S rRNA (adenine(2503)-C(2))-methyltransferase RlmN [Frankia sp. AgW1.1]MBL7546869.1 23S rRNA (adenine(2503)-C(2))-methyltransferase RlmN [Frankia sp. AgB1.9]
MTATSAHNDHPAGDAPGAGRALALTLTPRASRPKPPRHLADLSRDERRAVAVELGQPAFRADQLARHYFTRLAAPGDTAGMTDVPAAVRAPLADALLPQLLTATTTLTCDDGATRKTAWRTVDGATIESVLMRYPDRATVCVSSQAGCGMGCPFCATGQGGLTRNLTVAEIVEQVVDAARVLRHGGLPANGGLPAGQAGDTRLSNVVFMGMGEPLANYKALVTALHRISDPAPDGLGISARTLTVSTVGLVPAIGRLAGEGLPVRLAVSLHAPDDELRDTLVPINTRWKVAEVLDAAWDYAARTGRRISIEYALIDGVNDQPERADLLGRLLRDRPVHVNLIPLNPTRGSSWHASVAANEREFVARLRARGITTTVRDTRGREIAAACGQLAADNAAVDHGRR